MMALPAAPTGLWTPRTMGEVVSYYSLLYACAIAHEWVGSGSANSCIFLLYSPAFKDVWLRCAEHCEGEG